MSGFHPTDLIRLVKARPPLYNRDLQEHPRRDHKHRLWLEVAENLTPPEDWIEYSDVEKDATSNYSGKLYINKLKNSFFFIFLVDQIQAKWKHLKDHFHRELKLIDAGDAHRKRRYVYFKEMEFMRPFVGYKQHLPSNNKRVKMESVNFMEQTSECHDADMEMYSFIKTNDEEEEEETEPTTKHSRTRTKSAQKHFSTPIGKRLEKGVKKPAAKRTISDASKLRDPDVTFCLSLIPNLRKLSDTKKLIAKMEILQVLIQFVDHNQNSYFNRSKNIENEVDPDMQDDHLDNMDGEGVYVKNEAYNEQLVGDNGNTKTWWT